MSQTTITLAFEQWKAQQAIDGKAVVLDEFVLANVPNLDIDSPIDRAEQLPAAQHIVHRQAVSATGLVNENAVVYSVTMGTEVGDFSFNWVGLINKATGTLAMIVHAPLQSKIKNAEGKQGNVLTRSFLMEYNGAASETQITTPAETWQIDFTARLSGMDERQRLENVDLYGVAAFFGDGFLVMRAASQYSITQGIGYVGGLRCQLPATQNITVTTKPVKVWADVCWKGTLTSVWAEELKITVANTLANYVQDGVQHYVFAVANIDANGVITDLRPKGSLDGQQGNKDFLRIDKSLSEIAAKGVQAQEEARKHLALGDVATKNIQSSQTDSTVGAVMTVPAFGLGGTAPRLPAVAGATYDNIPMNLPTGFYTHQVAGGPFCHTVTLRQDGGAATSNRHFIIPAQPSDKIAMRWDSGAAFSYQYFYTDKNKPTATDVGALPSNGNAVSATKLATARKIAGKEFDGTSDVVISASDVGALPSNGNAVSATKLATARKIAGKPFNGTADIAISAGDVGALPATGGTLNGNLAVKYQLQVGSVGSGVLNIGDSDSGLRSTIDGQVDLCANGRMYGYWNATELAFSGRIIPTDYANFDARYQAKGNYANGDTFYDTAENTGVRTRDKKFLISVGASGTMGFWNEAKQQFVFWVDSDGKLLKGIVPAALVSGLAEIGVNQTWRDVTKQRALNTVYTNSSGKPIFVSVSGKDQQQKSYIDLWIGAVRASTYYKDANSDAPVSAIVPAGAAYKVTTVGGALINWAELS